MEKGKVIFIGGNKRAGKTTLSIKLHKEAGYNYYDMDMLLDALENGIPSVSHPGVLDSEYYMKYFENLVERALNDAKNYGVNSVFNYIDFTPKYMTDFK